MKNVPEDLKVLLDKREHLKAERKFYEADKVRTEIEGKGYILRDMQSGPEILKEEKTKAKKSFLVLFGSGEISPTGGRVHEEVIQQIGVDNPKIVIISTPAGFQPNVETVCGEIEEFLKVRLGNYHPEIKVIYANNSELANDDNVIKAIDDADYIFMGPGSPTYGVRHLKETKLIKKIVDRIKDGATLSLASAATISFSRYAQPVYEIYKVGTDLYWENGLDVYSQIYEVMTIIPHWNNTEGGEKTDTSRCFIGHERFNKMLKLLPNREGLVGIDEQTGVIIDLKTKEVKVLGEGKLHLNI